MDRPPLGDKNPFPGQPNASSIAGDTPVSGYASTDRPTPMSSAPTNDSVTSIENVEKLKRQIMGSQVAAAQSASPMPTSALSHLTHPLSVSGTGNPIMDTLSHMLKMLQDTPQPQVDAKNAEAYRRTLPHHFPLGIDQYALAQERERLIKHRINSRITQLQSLLNDSQALSPEESRRYTIELKSLQLYQLQKNMRGNVLRVVQQLRSVDNLVERPNLRRNKKQTLREARLTERLEQQQRKERNKREQKSHYDFLQTIFAHHKELQAKWRAQGQKRNKLLKQVMHHHNNVEKEETRRLDKVAKDRLKALKADDEEAYLKLLDQQKDTRLTYLLKQTDEFLSGLAAKVIAQQADTANKMNIDAGVDMSKLFGDDDHEGGDDEEAAGGDYYSTAHRIKEVIEEQPKILIGGKLKEYQIKGLQWLVSLYNNHLNGMLADEMGLGKTIQAISLITHLIEKKNQMGPYLIIVPLSTMTNWSLEFERWAPSVIKVEYKGVPSQRKALQNQLKHGKFNVLLTTYEYIIKDKPFLSKIKWLYLIVDEGHRMKNAHSKLSTVLNQYYQTRFRLILTGTPLQNNLPELWSLLNFLLPRIFNSCKTFEEWFNAPFANTGEKVELNEEEMLLIIRRLHKVLRPFLLRRLKKDVEAELPEKLEMVLKCPMSSLQQTLYNMVTKRSVNALRDPKAFGMRRLNNTIMQLRKICNHPFVFPEVEQQMNPRHINNELLYRSAGKFELLHRILPKLRATGHKVLIFFQMTQIMTIMEDFLTMQKFSYLRLDGSTKAEDRTDLLKKFNAPDSPYFIFLLSTRAGGLGLNLQTADTVIIFDSDWNPHQDLQAQDRAHRIGQTKEVRIFRLVTIESVEEYILQRAQHKLSLDGKVIQAGKFDQKSTNEERDEMLRSIIEREAEKNDVEEIYGDDELNEIVARSDQELECFRKIDEEREAKDKADAERTGKVKSRLLEANELPKIYLDAAEEDVNGPADVDDQGDDLLDIRSSRLKKMISYNDNLTDRQWLDQLERGSTETPLSNASAAGLKRGRGRPPKKQRRIISDDSDSEALSVQTASTQATTSTAPRIKFKIPKRRLSDLLSRASSLNLELDETEQIMRRIFEALENCMDEETNRYRSDIFVELPDQATYPDYYQLIKQPICMSQIEARINDHQYPSLVEFMRDLELMFDNAMTYNVEGSIVYEDAQIMKQLSQDQLEDLLQAEGDFGSQITRSITSKAGEVSDSMDIEDDSADPEVDDEEDQFTSDAVNSSEASDDGDDDEY